MASKKKAPAAPVVTAEAVSGADGAAVAPAPETVKGSRDERHDSIDPATGALTAEAIALRAGQ